MKLTENFTLEELTVTSTGLKNVPGTNEIVALQRLTLNVLQPVREMFGNPIRINSGYRSVSVNKAVGGSETSSHCKGEAADLSCDDNAELFRLLRDNFKFDQLIWEGGDDNQPAWVHVSFKVAGNRHQVLKMRNGKYEFMS
ncbi:MAG: hypothetical protein A2W90_18025 [Bacteroidetes bacterium GWF2_42_66]|nr:MAG: hypothetical protein A2W92_22285 [Bacteroidetes bacterium GWA2_42_15]OFX98150.1 MAG: hypothetical protein A2W89_09515 [Bacteroidetes bacterium GWE2_42_39]OFY42535.1 MAG: hypothetical protein A2W90_18025 [Bacteroidetes bacterium GWF2_42_66]HBL74251.1 peptidase M15 [Prolixibacteraceae bacterium]HCU64020.1 peptidase M15 [Prolixibacteraceae bacterium]